MKSDKRPVHGLHADGAVGGLHCVHIHQCQGESNIEPSLLFAELHVIMILFVVMFCD